MKEQFEIIAVNGSPHAGIGNTAMMIEMLRPALAETFQAHLRIAKGVCSCHDDPAAAPAIVIRTPAEVWQAIAAGTLDSQQAFRTGKYRVEGDLSLLPRLQSLFPG